MVEKIFQENLLTYTIVLIFGLGMILKLVLCIGYSQMITASKNIEQTKNKTLRNMKIKFETFHRLKIGVNNVDTFVDKRLKNHKIHGVLLITLEKLSGQAAMVCALIGGTGALTGLLFRIETRWILSVFTVGFLTTGLLIFFEALLNIKGKREIIRLNILDYFDNFLKSRMELEEKHPEIIEAYKKEIQEVNTPRGKTERQISREKRIATRQFKKQTRVNARRKRIEDKKKKRLELAQARTLEKIRKKEERHRQVEIKKALNLEKQLSFNKAKEEKKTPAQQSKESLKKEIEEIRQLEARNNDQVAVTIAADLSQSGIKELNQQKVCIDNNIYNKKVSSNNNLLKKEIQDEQNKYDEQIVEEILRKYLA